MFTNSICPIFLFSNLLLKSACSDIIKLTDPSSASLLVLKTRLTVSQPIRISVLNQPFACLLSFPLSILFLLRRCNQPMLFKIAFRHFSGKNNVAGFFQLRIKISIILYAYPSDTPSILNISGPVI